MASQIVEHLMAPGSWEIDLDPSTPEEILELSSKAFDRVVVTPTRLDPRQMSRGAILDRARYCGLLRDLDGRLNWSGPGLAVLLGDEDSKGAVFIEPVDDIGPLPKYDGGADSWIANTVLDARGLGSNGITVGDIVSAGSPTFHGNTEVGDVPRDILDWICGVSSADKHDPQEWRLNHDGTLDQRKRSVLWPTTTAPTAIALRAGGASTYLADGTGLQLLPVLDFGATGSWKDWTSATNVVGPDVTLFGLPYTFSGRDEIDDNPFVGLDGSPLVMEAVVTSNKARNDAADAALAKRTQGRHEDETRRLDVTVDLEDLAEVGTVGDTIWAFDIDDGLRSHANLVWLGAEPVFPIALRIVEATNPIRDRHGVYLLPHTDDGFDIVDLSDYVVAGTGAVRLGVGAPRRRLHRHRS